MQERVVNVRRAGLPSWDARAGGLVNCGLVWFLRHERVPQFLGFPCGSESFEDEARAGGEARKS